MCNSKTTNNSGDMPPRPHEFAEMLLKRIRAAGATRTVEYDAKNFRLQVGNTVVPLVDMYRNHVRFNPAQREDQIRQFLRAWPTLGREVPEDFDDARVDIFPRLCPRAHAESRVRRIAASGRVPSLSYDVIGEHLARFVVYDWGKSWETIDDQQFRRWGTSFDDAKAIAMQNLVETPTEFVPLGPVYAVTGDDYAAARIALVDDIRRLEVVGDLVVMVPSHERLYVTGSEDDAGLARMADFAAKALADELSISGIAFRLEGDDWRPWLPPRSHRLYPTFVSLRTQTLVKPYAEQAALLNERFDADGTEIFVASYSVKEHKPTGEVWSECIWAEGVDSLLPETDTVVLFSPTSGPRGVVVASGHWETVQRVVGELMVPQGLYPERWRVSEFPSDAMLREIGMLPPQR